MIPMSNSVGKILVSVGEKCACVKITGRANCTSSTDFNRLLDELWRTGCLYFVLDLTECVLMDSTFLGVLSGFGLKVHTAQPDQIKRTLELFNPGERVVELLENLGVWHLFTVTQGSVVPPENGTARELPPAQASAEDCKRTSLEAHQLLIQINPANAAKFKDVVAYLAEDLKKVSANKS